MAERCHLEIHLDGGWHTAGELCMDEPARGMQSAASFDYDFDFLDRYAHRLGARDVHAVSCRYGLGYQAYRQESWPAFLLDIVPSGAARRTWERELELPNTSASDWPLLLRGGDNPIGNLRIREAAAASRNQVTAAHPGFARAEVLARATDFLEYARRSGAAVAGGSGAGGDAPKFLLREDHDGRYHADGALADEHTARLWLVKFPRSGHVDDRAVLRAEAIYWQIATQLGVRTAGALEWVDDTLFVPRFDRVREGNAIRYLGVESLCSLAGVAEFGVAIAKERLAAAVVAHVSVQPEAELRELLLRDVLDLALGNTDNHARNTAVLKHVDGTVALSPLFDFAPMFLDTQGIARVCRWRSERTGALDWHDVVRALEPHGLDAAKTLRWLAELSETVRVLPTLLHDAGLEPRVLARCAPLIERTAGSLEALR